MSEDVREGKPSASGVYRIVACPGSPAAERGQPELPAESWTQEGSDIHAAVETGDTSELQEDTALIASKLKGMEMSALDAWLNQISGYDGTVPSRHVEERLWIRDRKTLELVASAQLDVFYVIGEHSLLIDNKTGYADVPAADKNWQLICQALCLKQEYPEVKYFRVAIASSRLSSKLDVAEYSAADLEHAERELFHAIWLSNQPEAQRRPSAACRYCRAKHDCPEGVTFALVTQQRLGIKSADKLQIVGSVNRLTPHQLAEVFVKSKVANIIFDAVEAKLKAMTEPQLAELGLMLKPGAVQKKIVDNPVAQERLAPSLDLGEVISCSKISVTELANLYAAKHSVSKVSAKEAILELLGDAVEQTQNSPSLAVLK